MAEPLSPSRMLAALEREGVKVREYRSWRTHNRNHRGPWGGVNGCVIHHTAGRDSLRLVYEGRSDLPGPLAHGHLAKSGVLSLTGNGRANHAGMFAANAHRAVVNESNAHPVPDYTEPIDGNQHYYGLEIENLGDGRDPYPAVQYDQAVRWAAAICRAHGWGANSVIGHKEGTRRKIDPKGPLVGGGHFDMDKFRAAVAARLKHPPGDDVPIITPPQETDMPLSKDDVDKVWTTDGLIKSPNPEGDNKFWAPASYLRDTNLRMREVQSKLAAQSAAIAELAKTVASFNQNIDADALVARITEAIENVTIHLDVPEA